jgi:hypothetical protein
MANGKIHSTKETEKLFGSSPGLAKLRDLWNSPRSVSWIIAWELAPIFKRHFGRRATASMPSEASGVRTPQGPFVRFVQSVQQNLKLFPGQESVPPHTIDSALRKSKTQRDEQARADARVGPLLQGDLQRKI